MDRSRLGVGSPIPRSRTTRPIRDSDATNSQGHQRSQQPSRAIRHKPTIRQTNHRVQTRRTDLEKHFMLRTLIQPSPQHGSSHYEYTESRKADDTSIAKPTCNPVSESLRRIEHPSTWNMRYDACMTFEYQSRHWTQMTQGGKIHPFPEDTDVHFRKHLNTPNRSLISFISVLMV
jgi:hypothetical protein